MYSSVSMVTMEKEFLLCIKSLFPRLFVGHKAMNLVECAVQLSV